MSTYNTMNNQIIDIYQKLPEQGSVEFYIDSSKWEVHKVLHGTNGVLQVKLSGSEGSEYITATNTYISITKTQESDKYTTLFMHYADENQNTNLQNTINGRNVIHFLQRHINEALQTTK